MYKLFRLAAWSVPRLPIWLRQILGKLLGLLAWLLAHKARKQAYRNIRQVLGLPSQIKPADRRRTRRIVRRMFYYNVLNYLDVFAAPSIKKDAFLSRIRYHHVEHLEAALALGKGAIIFSAHLGPFNHLIHWLSFKGYTTTIPVERLKDERVLKLMLDLRRSQGINFIPLGGSAPIRALFTALRNNQIVLITADRAIEGETIEKSFFGAKAMLPLGPVQLAQHTGAALIGGFGWHAAENLIEVQFTPLSLALPAEQRNDPECLTDHVVETLEKIIAAHPEQWLVFAPVWSDPT